MRVAFKSGWHGGAWSRAATVVCGLVFSWLGPGAAWAAGRHAAMIIDANTGQVLHAQAADEARYPASLTKMMTIFLAFEMMEQGRLTPTTRIKISDEAAGTSPSKLGLAAGSDIAAMDAIRALIVKSANDIAVALAEHMAGSETKFAALMTRRARELGMTATTFKNAHGLPDSGQVTTARDMLTLALALNDRFPERYRLFSLAIFNYGGHVYRNHNTMMHSFSGMDGLKTGYTSPSGFNLVASVRRDGRHVVAAVFGGATASGRNAHMRTILMRALPRASTERSRKPAPALIAASGRRLVAAATKTAEPPAPKLVEAIKPAAPPARIAAATPPPVRPAPAAQAVTPQAPAPHQALAQAQPPAQARSQSRSVVQLQAQAPLAPPALTDAKSAEITPEANAGAPIHVAQVRQVAVPSQQRQFAAPVALLPPTAPASPQASETATPVAPREPIAAALPPAAAPAAAPPRMAGTGAPAIAPAAQPSTLQAQAERMAGKPFAVASAAPTVAPPTFRLAGPGPGPSSAPQPRASEPAIAPSASGKISIQVGAYASAAEATRQLEATKAKSGALLAQARPVTQAVASGGRQLYRARFAGFDAAAAAAACNDLRRLQIDCQVTRD